MKDFMFLFRGGNDMSATQSPEAMQKSMQKWGVWMETLTKQGKMTAGQPLVSGGKTVSGTKMHVTDGPFMEGKEIVGGYIIIKATDINEAVEVSKGCPIFENDGSVEVREVQEMPAM